MTIPVVTPIWPTLLPCAFHHDGWVYEETVDGYRTVAYNAAGGVRFVSRFEWLRERPKDEVSTPPLFIAFDCLVMSGKDLRGLPLRERRDIPTSAGGRSSG
jgi:ATP-dependent DNA ligase